MEGYHTVFIEKMKRKIESGEQWPQTRDKAHMSLDQELCRDSCGSLSWKVTAKSCLQTTTAVSRLGLLCGDRLNGALFCGALSWRLLRLVALLICA